jgi:flagellin
VDNAIGSIDRIAQTTKFANTKLLDGSAAIRVTSTVGSQLANINVQNAQFDGVLWLTLTINMTQIASRATLAAFRSATQNSVVRITGPKGTEDITLASGAGSAAFASAINAFTANTNVWASGGRLLSVEFGSDQTISLEVVSGAIVLGGATLTSANGIQSDAGRDVTATMQGASLSAKGNTLRVLSSVFTGDVTLIDAATSGSGANHQFTIKKTGLNFQLNTSEAASDRERIGIRSMDPSLLGTNTRTIKGQAGTNVTIGGFLSSLQSGGTNDLDSNPENALRIVDKVIDQVTDARSFLGAFQKMTVDSNLATIEVAAENLAASESDIRDLDFAAETTQFTKNQILFQAGMAVFGQANQIAQTVLTLLR